MTSQDKGEARVGSGHLRAMARLGLAELRGALYPGSNVAQPTEYGVFGRETPGEVAMHREPVTADQEPKSVLTERLEVAGDKLRQQEQSDRPREGKSQEPERG